MVSFPMSFDEYCPCCDNKRVYPKGSRYDTDFNYTRYEYQCEECGSEFDIIVTDHDVYCEIKTRRLWNDNH